MCLFIVCVCSLCVFVHCVCLFIVCVCSLCVFVQCEMLDLSAFEYLFHDVV